MNKRRSKRNLARIVEEMLPDKRDTASNTVEEIGESFKERSIEVVQSPVFNIHIHVPAERKRDASNKTYLPHIQPIIHFHFDELEKTFGKDKSLQSQEVNLNNLKRVISRTSSRFGNVSFHKNSFNKDIPKNDISTSSPSRVLRKHKNSVLDSETNKREKTEVRKEGTLEVEDQSNCRNTSISCSRNKCGNMNKRLSRQTPNADHPIKLKKAIVVLEDICKSKSYKNIVRNELVKQNDMQISNTAEDSLDSVEKLNSEIKMENTFSSDLNDESSSDNVLNLYGNGKYSESVGPNLNNEGKCSKWETLSSLTEGCNFSEILKRFRGEGVDIVDLKKGTNLVVESTNVTETTDVMEGINVVESTNIMESTIVVKTTNVESANVRRSDEGSLDKVSIESGCPAEHSETEKQNISSGHLQVSKECTSAESEGKNEKCEVLQKENDKVNGEIESSEIKSQLLSKDQAKQGVELNELNNVSSSEAQEVERRENLITERNDMNCSINQFFSSDTDSDNSESANNNKVISKIVEDLEIVGFDSANSTSNPVVKTDISLSDPDAFISVEKEHENFDLKLFKEEMSTPKPDSKEKKHKKRKKTESESKKMSSPKKLKESHEKREKSSVNEDYISLNVSKSTRFAVAPLPNIQAYKSHSAKSFKNDMLYGNRLSRFSSSDQFYTYKLKKQIRKLK